MELGSSYFDLEKFQEKNTQILEKNLLSYLFQIENNLQKRQNEFDLERELFSFSSNYFGVSTPETLTNHSQDFKKCQFCQELILVENLSDHHKDCNRETHCKGCGEKMEINIYHFHIKYCQSNYEYFNNDEDDLLLLKNDGNEENLWDETSSHNSDYLEPTQSPQFNNDYLEENLESSENETNSDFSLEEQSSQSENENTNSLTYEEMLALDSNIVKKGLTSYDLKKFPLEVFLKGLEEEYTCNICLSDFESGEIIRNLNCSHQFHQHCIDAWLHQNITCPICKKLLR